MGKAAYPHPSRLNVSESPERYGVQGYVSYAHANGSTRGWLFLDLPIGYSIGGVIVRELGECHYIGGRVAQLVSLWRPPAVHAGNQLEMLAIQSHFRLGERGGTQRRTTRRSLSRFGPRCGGMDSAALSGRNEQQRWLTRLRPSCTSEITKLHLERPRASSECRQSRTRQYPGSLRRNRGPRLP
jgi:hypothetical protein